MVDLGGLADKAKDLVGDNSDKIKDGISKVGDFVGDKIGHDKVDPVEDKLHGFVDQVSGKDKAADAAGAAAVGEPATDPAPPSAPADPPAASTPPAS